VIHRIIALGSEDERISCWHLYHYCQHIDTLSLVAPHFTVHFFPHAPHRTTQKIIHTSVSYAPFHRTNLPRPYTHSLLIFVPCWKRLRNPPFISAVYGFNFLRFGFRTNANVDHTIKLPERTISLSDDDRAHVQYLVGMNGHGKSSVLSAIFWTLNARSVSRDDLLTLRNESFLGDNTSCGCIVEYFSDVSKSPHFYGFFLTGTADLAVVHINQANADRLTEWKYTKLPDTVDNTPLVQVCYVPTHHGSRSTPLEAKYWLENDGYITITKWNQYYKKASEECKDAFRTICQCDVPPTYTEASGGHIDAFLTLYAVCCAPQTVVLLDEPGQNLGAAERLLLRSTISTFAQSRRKYVLISTHHPELINTLSLPKQIHMMHRTNSTQRSTSQISVSAFDLAPKWDELKKQNTTKDQGFVNRMLSIGPLLMKKKKKIFKYSKDSIFSHMERHGCEFTHLLFSDHVAVVFVDQSAPNWIEVVYNQISDADTTHVSFARFTSFQQFVTIVTICYLINSPQKLFVLLNDDKKPNEQEEWQKLITPSSSCPLPVAPLDVKSKFDEVKTALQTWFPLRDAQKPPSSSSPPLSPSPSSQLHASHITIASTKIELCPVTIIAGASGSGKSTPRHCECQWGEPAHGK